MWSTLPRTWAQKDYFSLSMTCLLGRISGSKKRRCSLTLPTIRQASVTSCSIPVLLLELSWKRNEHTETENLQFIPPEVQRFLPNFKKNWKNILINFNQDCFFGGSVFPHLTIHVVVWYIYIYAVYMWVCSIPYLVSTVLRVGLLEVPQGLHYCWGTFHIAIIYHDVTCLCVREKQTAHRITNKTFHNTYYILF